MQSAIENHFKRRSMASPDRILVATDLTDLDYLLPHAIAQAKAGGAHVTLVHTLLPTDLMPDEAGALPYVDEAKIDREARMTMIGIARQLQLRGITCNSFVRRGYAGRIIRDELSRIEAGRLIMGSHGRGKLGQLVLGSVAHELLSKVDIPIFIVGPHARDAMQNATPRRILHPVSLLGEYEEGVRVARDIAQTYRAELTLLHVLDCESKESINPERSLGWAPNALDALIPNASYLVPPVHVMVAVGRLEEEILKAATLIDADWIVLDNEEESRPWSFKESVAYKVLAAAHCPVLRLCYQPLRAHLKNLEELQFAASQ